MHQHFQRLFNIVRKTGNNLVIFDPESKDPYILMNLDEYEELLEGYADPAPSNQSTAPRSTKEQNIVLKEEKEGEVIPGVDTEIVDLGASEKEADPAQDEKYYFEDVQQDEESEEKDEKQKEEN